MYDNPFFWLALCPLLGVAGYSALAAWFRGDLFAGARARCEALRDADPGTLVGRLFGELTTCPFCLSYHVSFWLAVGVTAFGYAPGPLFLITWWIAQVVAYALYRLSDDPLSH